MKIGILQAACAALTLAAATPLAAQMPHGDHGAGAATIAVEKPWARASAGKTGAAYVTLVNRGGSDDRLVAVRADIAARAELHTHLMEGNIMRMREVESVPVPAGQAVTLQPGGYHVMMMGLKRGIAEGDHFPMTLVFEKAGDITVEVPVMKMGAMGPGAPHGHGHGGMGH